MLFRVLGPAMPSTNRTPGAEEFHKSFTCADVVAFLRHGRVLELKPVFGFNTQMAPQLKPRPRAFCSECRGEERVLFGGANPKP